MKFFESMVLLFHTSSQRENLVENFNKTSKHFSVSIVFHFPNWPQKEYYHSLVQSTFIYWLEYMEVF